MSLAKFEEGGENDSDNSRKNVLLLRLITNIINCSQSMLYQIKLKVNAERRCRNFFFVNFITLLVLLLYLNANSRMQYPIPHPHCCHINFR
jgi:hypothetical protein